MAGRAVNLGTQDAAEAARRWHRIQAGQPLEEAVPAAGATFLAVADAYLAWLERERSAEHYRTARDRLLVVADHWSGRAAAGLTMGDLERLLAGHPAWGPTRRDGIRTALRGCLRWAVRHGMLATNPLAAIQVGQPQRREHVLSAEQIAAWLLASPPALRWLLGGLAATGARPSELARAEPRHLDADGGAIRLPTGKQGARSIHFPPAWRPLLLRAAGDGRAWLFPTSIGSAWRTQVIGAGARKARLSAGLPAYATAYTLRHTWITERVREGVPLGTVARMAGTSLAMISAAYAHLSDRDAAAVAERL